MMTRVLKALFAASALFFGCTTTPLGEGGGASETVACVSPLDNGNCHVSVSGKSFDVTVMICHELYSPQPDDTGRYRDIVTLFSGGDTERVFTGLSGSVYNIIFMDSSAGLATLIRFDNSASDRSPPQTKELTRTGSFEGRVTIVAGDGSVQPAIGYSVYLRGTPLSALTDEDGDYRLEMAPEGSYFTGTYKKDLRYGGNRLEHTIGITGDSLSIQNFSLEENN